MHGASIPEAEEPTDDLPMTVRKDWLPSATYLVLCMAGLLWSHQFRPVLSGALPLSDQTHSDAVNATTNALELLVSTAGLAFAGCGILIVGDKGAVRVRSRLESVLVLSATAGLALSMYFAFTTYVNIAALLDQGAFSSTSAPVDMPMRASFYCLIASVFLIGLMFAIRVSERSR